MAGNAFTLPKARSSGAPYFSRNKVAAVLHQVAVLLELQGANVFRVRSYQNGSRLIGTLTEDLHELVVTGRLFEMKGIGKGLGSALSQAILEGTWPEDWIRLHEDTPQGLIEMLGIPGLGPKRIKLMHEELGVDSIVRLKEAAEQGRIAPMKGFGKKSEQRMLDGIELLSRFRARRRLDIGLKYGTAFEQRISTIPGVERVALAGSARRRKETIGDLDVVVGVQPEHHDAVAKSILELQGIADVKGAGDSKISLILEAGSFEDGFSLGHIDTKVLEAIGGEDYEQLESAGTIDAQVRLVPPEMFAFTLAYFTGSKEHNIAMRQRAIDRGLRLNEFGLIPEAKAGALKGIEAAKYSLPAMTEQEIYSHLDLQWVPPELREDTGEIQSGSEHALPNLLELDAIHGALHNHTVASDGEGTLEQMADAAQALGWSWLGISDHSQSLKIANGMPVERMLEQGQTIRKYNQKWQDEGVNFRLFHGVESDILAGGTLDYPDDILSQLDYVVASVHAMTKWRGRDESENTEELLTAIEHPATKVLGHPTGRILQGREGYEVDVHKLIDAMAEHINDGQFKAIELNASPYRLDIDYRLCKYAKLMGVPVAISPDAHSMRGLTDVQYGVMTARKGWLERGDVINSMSADALAQQFALQ